MLRLVEAFEYGLNFEGLIGLEVWIGCLFENWYELGGLKKGCVLCSEISYEMLFLGGTADGRFVLVDSEQ